jgi:hypothetical protein
MMMMRSNNPMVLKKRPCILDTGRLGGEERVETVRGEEQKRGESALNTPQLAVGSLRTGLGRGDVSSRGGGVMGGMVVVVAQCDNGASGSDAAGFSFFPSSGPAPITRCDSANATISFRPPAPPPSEGPSLVA